MTSLWMADRSNHRLIGHWHIKFILNPKKHQLLPQELQIQKKNISTKIFQVCMNVTNAHECWINRIKCTYSPLSFYFTQTYKNMQNKNEQKCWEIYKLFCMVRNKFLIHCSWTEWKAMLLILSFWKYEVVKWSSILFTPQIYIFTKKWFFKKITQILESIPSLA